MSEEVSESVAGESYTVVARRYRPKNFDQLIGQEHIATALRTAIETGRVGHAYLFTGARGVGKTSTARIFAKVLNTLGSEDQELIDDISAAIDSGEDMDVIEIDGASNRGIEEIRQLRANVNVRPSRARYKIYIIDEVHMLTNQAFNALLKTLEEPPPHVKFIFCTTDPDKIPITVLSRCQRFDFSPVKIDAIQQRLKEISIAEGYEVEDEALALLARRAAGSMRDSQSLLEQVMSFSAGAISVEQVHTLLGTADEGRLMEVVESLKNRDALAAIETVGQVINAGTDPGQLAEQLMNYLRDVMAAGVGAAPDLLKLANPAGHGELKALCDAWGLQTVLSAIQILDESLVRMRSSISASTLLEVALVQICQLESLASIPALLESLRGNRSDPAKAAGSEKKNAEVTQAESQLASASPASADPATDTVEATPTPASAQVSSLVHSDNAVSTPSAQLNSPTPVATSDSGVGESNASKSNAGESNTSKTETNAALNTSPAPQPSAPPAAVTPAAPAQPQSTAAQPQSTAVQPQSTAVQPQSTAVQPQSTAAQSPSTVASAATNSAAAPSSSAAAASPAQARPAPAPAPTNSMASRSALESWKEAVKSINGMLADFAGIAHSVEAIDSENWRVVFPPGGTTANEYCSAPANRAELTAALQAKLGRKIQLAFSVMPGKPVQSAEPPMAKSAQRAKKLREMSEHPFVKRVCEVLEGEIVRVDSPQQ